MVAKKRYEIVSEFDNVVNKTKWIDAEDYFEIEPFLRQAEIEIERQTRRDVIAALEKDIKAGEGCKCVDCVIARFKEKFSI